MVDVLYRLLSFLQNFYHYYYHLVSFIACSSSITSFYTVESKPLVGSSRNNIHGIFNSSSQILNLFFCPPDNVAIGFLRISFIRNLLQLRIYSTIYKLFSFIRICEFFFSSFHGIILTY